MSDFKGNRENEIFTRVLKAGRRTYFFDVRETKAGDYYLTITESKRSNNEEGAEPTFEKHKIYLYKEDFINFKDFLNETSDFIVSEKGEEVISERHTRDYKPATNSFTINSEDEL